MILKEVDMKRWKSLLLFLCVVAFAMKQPLGAQTDNMSEIEVRETVYHKDIQGYLAIPQNAIDAPALILIHEWWGLNDDIRAKAEEFAQAGYVALAVDLYGGESTNKAVKAIKLASGVRGDQQEAFANLRSAVQFLRNLPETDGERIGSVGWCFGGGWSYQIARNNLGVKASVIYYGRFNPDDDLSKMKATILGHFGEKDRSIKIDNVKQFQAQLQTLSGAHDIFIYPNAGHGFANPDSSAYDRQSADAAYQRTLDFFARHL